MFLAPVPIMLASVEQGLKRKTVSSLHDVLPLDNPGYWPLLLLLKLR